MPGVSSPRAKATGVRGRLDRSPHRILVVLSSSLVPPRSRLNAESLVIARDRLRNVFHRPLEVFVPRVDIEPLLQDVVRRQMPELFDDRRLMLMFRAHQHAVPLPSSRLGWLDKDHHLAAEKIRGQPAEHPLREEASMLLEGLKDPFVVERFHSLRHSPNWRR